MRRPYPKRSGSKGWRRKGTSRMTLPLRSWEKRKRMNWTRLSSKTTPCGNVIYRKYFENPTPENMPLLEDLYNALLTQDEPEARHVAAALEIYVKGSLNIFNHHTNVDINNRIVCFDIKQLGKQLKKLGILQKLMHRPDVDSIVNSCDSGREGELIFRLVYQQAECKKPFSRLWLSSIQKLKPIIRSAAAYAPPEVVDGKPPVYPYTPMPELQIIPQEEFEAAQRIREDRSAHAAEEAEHHVPLRTRGQALLSNNVYCGHCGARLALTTSRKWRKLSDGTLDDTLRIRYTCYGKLRKQTDCTGQTGYTMHILDEIIDKMVRQIFSRLRGIPKEQLITSRYAKETAERKNHLQALQAERDKAEKDLLALKTEILAVIKGESAFPKDTLAEMIAAQEKKHTELETLCEEASAELERNAELMANVSQLYEELISYADLYDSASFEAKKMIVSQLIRRVEVYRGYQIHVDFNFDLAQYLENSDELAC